MKHFFEVGVSPRRDDFNPVKPRRWYVTDCMVPVIPAADGIVKGQQVRGRYMVPLELVQRPGCDPMLVGGSGNGAKFQIRVQIPLLDKDGKPVLDEQGSPQTVPAWRDLPGSPPGVPHPAKGPMVVVILPSTRVVRVFEEEADPSWVLTTPGDSEGLRMELGEDEQP